MVPSQQNEGTATRELTLVLLVLFAAVPAEAVGTVAHRVLSREKDPGDPARAAVEAIGRATRVHICGNQQTRAPIVVINRTRKNSKKTLCALTQDAKESVYSSAFSTHTWGQERVRSMGLSFHCFHQASVPQN